MGSEMCIRDSLRIWVQTLIPPGITMSLYFIIFGTLIGRRIGEMDGYPYMEYIAPGLIMMSVITNSYGNVVGSFFNAKIQRHIEELLVSPMSEASLIGETNNSSICLCIFALKKLPTTLPYELVITDIIIRPGAIYSIYGYPSISPMRLPIRVPKIIK